MPPVSLLIDRLSCPVHIPTDAGYALEVAGFNTAVVHTPEIAVGAESAADVVAAMHFARDHGYPVHIYSTGHGAYA
ncbi:FAD-binding protein, partial [bacterium]